MRKILNYKPVMMVAGVLAAVIITFSQSFYHQAQSNLEKIKTEQSTDHDSKQALIATPSEAVVTSAVENVNVQVPSLLDELFTTDEEAESVSLAPAVLSDLFKTFLRAAISPNAP
ncbi:MAG: hypothetical protein JJE09_01370 [Bacteroidia bacterium]|nr:hypothetical protein [Bacteroidia bacterium]